MATENESTLHESGTKNSKKSSCGKHTSLYDVLPSLSVTEEQTGRRKSDKYLKLFQHLVNQSNDAIFIVDPATGHYIDVNLKACMNLGYTYEELLTMSIMDIQKSLPAIKSWREHVEEVCNEGSLVREGMHKRKDGTKFPVEVSIKYVTFEKVDYIIAFARDITDRKDAEKRQALLATILKLLNQMDTTSCTIKEIVLEIKRFSEYDAVGVRLSEGDDFPYYETVGFSTDFLEAERYLCERDCRGEIIRDSVGSPYLECMCGNIVAGRTNPSLPFFTGKGSFWTNSTTALLASTTEEDRQTRTRNRCNGEGYESVALIPLCSKGQTIGLLQINDSRKNVFTLQDIQFFEDVGRSISMTLDRREAEARAMRENQLASIGELAAGVAHEINNPINGIINYAQILENRNEPHDKEWDIANRIIKESNRVADIVSCLLSFARDNKEGKIEVSVDELIAVSLELVGAQLKKDVIDLRLDVPENMSVIVQQKQIMQVFLNIISNARYALNRHYPDNSGSKVLKITGERIMENNSPRIRVVFHDNGPGISKALMSKVMNPFFSTKPSDQGTGLGLSISNSILRDNGGELTISSEEGKFTKVFVSLPAGKAGSFVNVHRIS